MKTKYKRPTIYVNGKQKLVSRITMENHIHRKLLSTEIVHHKDENPFNNDINNLVIVSRSEHKKIHSDIGKGTRLIKKYFFDKDKLLLEYNKYKSAIYLSNLYDCSEMTIERELRKILNISSLKKYAEMQGWSKNFRRQQKRGTTYDN